MHSFSFCLAVGLCCCCSVWIVARPLCAPVTFSLLNPFFPLASLSLPVLQPLPQFWCWRNAFVCLALAKAVHWPWHKATLVNKNAIPLRGGFIEIWYGHLQIPYSKFLVSSVFIIYPLHTVWKGWTLVSGVPASMVERNDMPGMAANTCSLRNVSVSAAIENGCIVWKCCVIMLLQIQQVKVAEWEQASWTSISLLFAFLSCNHCIWWLEILIKTAMFGKAWHSSWSFEKNNGLKKIKLGFLWT